MDTSLAHENARLRALLQTQQDTIRQMAEYNRLLSQRVAAYASEINRLKALVTELQRMQFRKLSEKLHAHRVLLPHFDTCSSSSVFDDSLVPTVYLFQVGHERPVVF